MPTSDPDSPVTPAQFPRLLIMTCYPPDEQHGGGRLMRRLTQVLPMDRICWFSSRPLKTGRMPAGFEAVPFHHAEFRIPRPDRWGLSRWRQRVNIAHCSRYQAWVAARWAKQNQVEAVWGVMQEQMMFSAPLVARQLSVPLHLSVHDDPSYLNQGLGPQGIAWLEPNFLRRYAVADSRDVISDAMRRRYLKQTGADATVITDGVDLSPTLFEESVPKPMQGRLKIHSSGMIYDDRLLRDLMLALEHLYQQGKSPLVEWVLSGAESCKPLGIPWSDNIRWAGWIPDNLVRERLQQADFLYLQQPFSSEMRVFSETSFPTKLPYYLSARRPVLLHVPKYGTVAEFAQLHRLPFVLHEKDGEVAAQKFVRDLDQIGADSNWDRSYNSALRAFDLDVIRRQFRGLLQDLSKLRSVGS